MAEDRTLKLIDALCAPGVFFSIQFEKAVVFERRAVWKFFTGGHDIMRIDPGRMREFLRQTQSVRSARQELLRSGRGAVEKLVAICPGPERRDIAIAQARELGMEAVAASMQDAEITAPGVSKGAALLELCAWLGVEKSEAVAIGDSGNDLPLRQAVGCFVAMGNGTPEVKAAADMVTKSVTEDGAAAALEELLWKS